MKTAPSQNGRARGHTLPDDIVQRLNAMGLGGRTVYVPLISDQVDFRQSIVQRMVSDLLSGVFDRAACQDEFGRRRSSRTLDRYYAQAVRIVKDRRRTERALGAGSDSDSAGREMASLLNKGRARA